MTNTVINISAWAIRRPGEPSEVSFVPPLVRRRLSPLQKIYFALARAVESTPYASAVFATRDGEDTLTRRVTDEFRSDGTVSPHRFSTSVYNAAPGLWSVFTHNPAPYTAIAAGDDTIEAAFLEVLGGVRPVMLVYAEETGGGYGFAVRFEAEASPSSCRVAATLRNAAQGPITFNDAARFLTGESTALEGRFLILRRV